MTLYKVEIILESTESSEALSKALMVLLEEEIIDVGTVFEGMSVRPIEDKDNE